MKVFCDSSALAKRYIEEEGSKRLEEILQEASLLGVSVLCIPEMFSALNRRKRESSLTQDQYRQAKEAILRDAYDADIINLVPRIIGKAILLLEREGLKTLDALQVGSAIEWKPDLFLSSDQRQLQAATRQGLKTAIV